MRHWMVQSSVQLSLGRDGSGGSTVMTYSKLQSVEFHSRLNSHWLVPTLIIVEPFTVRLGTKSGGAVGEETPTIRLANAL